MRYIGQHITSIIASYDVSLPLAHFLKNYFRQYPILGSRDRKILSTVIYSWYRCGNAIDSPEWLTLLAEQLIQSPVRLKDFSLAPWLKQNISELPFRANNLFPYPLMLSDGIDKHEWLNSMLSQPYLFIRIRHSKEVILQLLREQNIPYTAITDTCLALPNGSKIEPILPADAYIVQDASSQRTGSFFHPGAQQNWYDCCCGAGGKSLLLKDMQPGVRLTVTDVRESIISNLKKRFAQYHHTLSQSFVTDASSIQALSGVLKNSLFDHIICDAPCSGSGTWARTPEQLYFFDPQKLEKFTSVQKAITSNVVNYLKPGGTLFYITCSVFRDENEDVVERIIKSTGLQLAEMHLINGISILADSMFVAILQKQ